MTQDDISRLRELAGRASDLPWRVTRNNGSMVLDPDGIIIDEPLRHQDAQYIVAACNALPRLLDEIERLQRANDALVTRCGVYQRALQGGAVE